RDPPPGPRPPGREDALLEAALPIPSWQRGAHQHPQTPARLVSITPQRPCRSQDLDRPWGLHPQPGPDGGPRLSDQRPEGARPGSGPPAEPLIAYVEPFFGGK